MRFIKEESICSSDHMIDLYSAVEELHGFSANELNKQLRDSENFSLHLNTRKGSPIQIDMEKLAWSLPVHLIAVLISLDRDEKCLRYLLRGVRLLHSLGDLASRLSRLEQILLDEVKITEQILDLVFYMLVVLARYEQETHIGSSLPLLHSALVACSLYLLTGYISSQWQGLVNVLLAHPKVDVFMDVAFDAVCVDIRFFQMKMLALNNEVLNQKSCLVVAVKTAQDICQQCEASLQVLQSLCQQKLFRERLLRNKELCKNGGILSLALAVLKLNVPQHFEGSSSVVAAVSRLKSKVLSILLQLCETESISYLDEVASSDRSMDLAKSVALEVLELLKTAFSKESKLLNGSPNCRKPKGLVLLNSMRLADIFSDDSNFRSFIMANITQVLAEIVALPHEEFLSDWCSTDLPVMEEDATLDYDPFIAAGTAMASRKDGYETATSASSRLEEPNTRCPLIPIGNAPVFHVQQRTSFLVKIIANLHCFVPNICEEEEKDQFFNKFLECLGLETPNSSPRLSFHSKDVQKAGRTRENLRSLLHHAESLVPKFLNEEDVHLLSVFFDQFQALFPSAQFRDDSIQDSVVKDVRGTHEKKFEDLYRKRQNSLCLTKFSNLDIGERHRMKAGASFHDVLHDGEIPDNGGCQLSDEVQSTGGCGSSLSRKLEATLDEVPYFRGKNAELKEESIVFQEVDQFDANCKKSCLPSDFMEIDRSRKKEKNSRAVEASEVDTNSKKSKSFLDNGDFPKSKERKKESASRGITHENERVETAQSEEKQPRKRKRNIMNEKQITLIERALLDEPEMQRNANSLLSWAEKLSVHGSELTSSQLKNWLNNRKARLARAAREGRAPSEGESAFPDKTGGSSLGHFYDSSESAGEDFYEPSRWSNQTSAKFSGIRAGGSCGVSEIPPTDFVDFAAQHGVHMHCPSLRYVRCETGQYVALMDAEGKEVGRGKVYQVEGRWHGKDLEDARTCVVEITELKVDRWVRLPHPLEAAGTTFEEAEAKNGKMRVAWDISKVILLTQ